MLIAAIAAQFAGPGYALACGLILYVLGFAHGAGDEQDGELRRFGALHVAGYLVVGAAIAALFLAAPLAGLVLFLALSAWHFARSDCAFSATSRLAIAALATGGSALFQRRETTAIFEQITAGSVPSELVVAFSVAGGVGVALAILALIRGESGSGHAVLSLGAVALFDPVLAVGLIFVLAHAVPVQQRQIASYGVPAIMRAVALPTGIAIDGAATIVALVANGLLAMQIAVALAFGMATPHMLTERLER